MKNTPSSRVLIGLIVSGLTLFVTGCSSEEPETAKTSAATTAVHKPKPDVEIKDEASKSVKADFVEKFTEVCVERELKVSVNPDIEKKRAEESCGCIAQHIADNLTEVDAEKYIENGEDTRTLQIKFDTATYFCLQNKKQFKGPQIFGKPQ